MAKGTSSSKDDGLIQSDPVSAPDPDTLARAEAAEARVAALTEKLALLPDTLARAEAAEARVAELTEELALLPETLARAEAAEALVNELTGKTGLLSEALETLARAEAAENRTSALLMPDSETAWAVDVAERTLGVRASDWLSHTVYTDRVVVVTRDGQKREARL